jgi:hypothetical protein
MVSCEYEPKGFSERSLQPPGETPELITLELDLPSDRDTAFLSYRHIWYGFESPGHRISWIKWYLDAGQGVTIRSAVGFFELPNFSQPSGWHNLRLEVCIASGTGSLADSLEMEGTVVTIGEWAVRILDTPYNKVTASVKDGFLRLRWPPAGDEKPEYTVSYMNQEIGKTTATEFTVREYVGQGGSFSVSYVDSREGNTVSYGYVELPEENKAGWQYNRNNDYYITFDKPVYFAAIDTLVLVTTEYGSSGVVLDRTTNPEQGHFILGDSLFGKKTAFWIVAVPKYRDPDYRVNYSSLSPYASPRIEVGVGFPSPAFNKFFRTGIDEFVYHGWLPDGVPNSDYIIRYSLLHDSIVDYAEKSPSYPHLSGEYFMNPSVSADGSWFTARIPFSQSAVVGSADNLSGYRVVDLTAVTSYSLVPAMPVSNTGLGIVISMTGWSLYDFRNDIVLAGMNKTSAIESQGISPDGEYMYLRTFSELSLFSWRNGLLNPEHLLSRHDSPFYDIFTFFPEDPGMAAGWDSATGIFYKLRCTDLSIQNSFLIPEEMILDVDFHDRMILSFSPHLLAVRSLDDGNLLYRIPVSFRYAQQGLFKLCGGSIFHRDGLRYFLR